MISKWIPLLAVLLCSKVSASEIQIANPAELLDFACSVMKYDCSSLPVPTVAFADLTMYRALGSYFGQGILVLDLNAIINSRFTIDTILVHELTHYADHEVGGIAFSSDTSCQTETNAFRVANAYVTYLGHPEQGWYNWQESYTGC